jgi:hypothetical protein
MPMRTIMAIGRVLSQNLGVWMTESQIRYALHDHINSIPNIGSLSKPLVMHTIVVRDAESYPHRWRLEEPVDCLRAILKPESFDGLLETYGSEGIKTVAGMAEHGTA